MSDTRGHWDQVYATKAEDEVSWYQSFPTTSVRLIEACNLPLDASIIDIGGGNSHLAEILLGKGFQNIYVLDISARAIEKAKRRLGDKSFAVKWIVEDISAFNPPVTFDLWHDRAAFHFLTDEERIGAYVSIATSSIKTNGYLILGTFSPIGPSKCSGLDIRQYSEETMEAAFGPAFKKLTCFAEDHTTPFHTVQNFQFCSFQKR